MLRDEITLGVIHCTATPPSQVVTMATVDAWHKKNDWSGTGYHWLVRRDGTITPGRTILFDFVRAGELWIYQGAHVRGYNVGSIGIALEGGLNSAGESVDVGAHPEEMYTEVQLDALVTLVKYCNALLPNIRRWCGHRDLSPDTNKDGTVTKSEWLKTCPGFDVRAWLPGKL